MNTLSLTRRAVLAALAAASLSAQTPRTDWRDYLGAPDSSHFSPLKQIGPANAARLQVAWSYPAGEGGSYVYAPLVVDNVAFVLAKGGSIVALDAATGKEIWTHTFGARTPAPAPPAGQSQAAQAPARAFGGGAGGARGLNYWESKDRSDRRILIAVSNQLQELDARTGKLIETFGDKGYVDLRVGLGRDPQTVRAVQSRTPGRVFENLIMLGSAPGESYVSPPGFLRAYNVLTGKLVWTFHTVPQPGEPGYDTWPKD
ncbi:MAG: PQQ-binding-like beta-propeller repeat protein, partial [Terriglobia bacterium]